MSSVPEANLYAPPAAHVEDIVPHADIRTFGRGGATPGKKAMGLQVVMDSGLPVTPAASLVRNLMRAADFMPAGYAFGFACMLLRADFKRIGDLAAGTLVVYAKPVSLHGPLPAA